MGKKVAVLSVRNGNKKHHVSYDTILGLEDAFCDECGCDRLDFSSSIYKRNQKNLKKQQKIVIADTELVEKASQYDYVFFASMGESDIRLCLPTLKKIRDKLIIYIFDSWVTKWDKQEKLLTSINPYAVCFAYEKAVEHFKEILSSKVIWLPQSMDARFYHEYDVSKTRLFMQIGRQTKSLHELIEKYLKANGKSDTPDNYARQRTYKELINNGFFSGLGRILRYRRRAGYTFPDKNILGKEMASTYFFICAPKNVEDYNKTGAISEVTARFYEAMACKTLPVGYKPQDNFDKLFPYENAMLEVDRESFDRQIDELLADTNKYKKLVEQNYEYVMKNHRWNNRFDYLIGELEK